MKDSFATSEDQPAAGGSGGADLHSSGILLDWDGCVALNDKPLPAAVEFIRRHRARIAIVSNNTTHVPEEFSGILHRAGVEISPPRIVLAGTEALDRAAEIGAARVLILGDNRMKAYARGRGLNIVPDAADLVVLLRDTRFTYAKLERAANCLRDGARLIVANPDLTHPGGKDRIVPETGALLAALMACVGSQSIAMEMIGKPSPRLFEKACRALRVRASDAVMIGDNPATDIAGAEAAGLRSVLIGGRSGVTFDTLVGDR